MGPSFLSNLIDRVNQNLVSTQPKRPGPLKSIALILYRLHTAEPLEHEVPQTLLEDLTARLKFGLHISQRAARILGTLLLRACIKHPLGWTIPQEVVCMLMYGILQSRQVPAWRAFFSGVGDLQHWVPVINEQVTTGSCTSWWVRLQPDQRPQQPHTTINWLFLHGGAFVAGDALMYTGVFAYWMVYLAKQGISCSILSVEYPLAPEHPFPAGVNAAADAIHWLLHESGDTEDYFVGGDSAGGNLALAGLTLLRDGGKLAKLPLGLTLISPAVDLSNSSVFGSKEPVSSHFEPTGSSHSSCGSHGHGNGSHDSSCSSSQQSTTCAGQGSNPGPPVNAAAGGQHAAVSEEQAARPSPSAAQLLTGSSFRQRQQPQQQQQQQTVQNVAQRQLQAQHVPLESHPSIDCKMHAAHTAGGKLRAVPLLRGVVGEVVTAVRVHTSSSSALQHAARGWWDYIPSDSFADELHCYVPDPKLLAHPLVSPTYLKDFTGLCQRAMLVVAGGAELMRPDIAAFAAKAAAGTGAAAAASAGQGAAAAAGSGHVPVVYHEEPLEPHVFPMLGLPHLMRKGLLVPRFVAAVVRGEDVDGVGGWRAGGVDGAVGSGDAVSEGGAAVGAA